MSLPTPRRPRPRLGRGFYFVLFALVFVAVVTAWDIHLGKTAEGIGEAAAGMALALFGWMLDAYSWGSEWNDLTARIVVLEGALDDVRPYRDFWPPRGAA